MSFSESIHRALDEREGRKARVSAGRQHAEVEVDDVDRLGVRVRRIRLSRGEEIDVERVARELPERMRTLHEPVVPIEVDAGHGRAVLRTEPEAMRRREFFEVEVQGRGEVDVRRFRVGGEGERGEVDWTLTREQLGRLLDEIAGQE